MDKTKLNYAIDMMMAVLLVIAFATGVVKWPGLHRTLDISQSSLVSDVHDWAGLLMGLAIMLHLLIHRGWIACMTKAILRGKK